MSDNDNNLEIEAADAVACPFCDKTKILVRFGEQEDYCWTICDNCGANGPMVDEDDVDECPTCGNIGGRKLMELLAVERWNKRA